MMIDALAERYGKLPSEILEKATTYDLSVFDVAVSYKNYKMEKEMQQKDPNYDPNKHMDTVALQKGLENFRERQNRPQ